MYSHLSEQYKIKFGNLEDIDINGYQEIIGSKEIEKLKKIAGKLEGKRWANVNSTFEGGGVAEMLKSIVPIARGLGIDCTWYCIEATDDFYIVTKKFHNIIQGLDQHFTLEELLDLYVNTNRRNFENISINADYSVVHDPQPCASVVHGNYTGKKVWRCHIDTSEANDLIWNFLVPYINNYDGVIFSHPEFVKTGVRKPVFQIPPSIDPLTVKNRQKTREESLSILYELLNEHNIDPERPIVLAVSRYDIHKNQETIVKVFKELKKDRDISKLKPILIIVGNSATDDPEGMEMFKKIYGQVEDDKDIFTLLNIPNNDENIGALMSIADVFIHISTKEGFGLVVTEAMWQGTPVIGSNVGGIRLQIINDKTGYLVEPFEIDKMKTYIKHILLNPEEKERLGYSAIEHVRNNFLVTNLVRRHLVLMSFYLGIDYPCFEL
ncbi:MAG: glycosyltransferase [Bacteroidales bacterium]|nr:glycosyltransferase [Bacteroidales bacterium]